ERVGVGGADERQSGECDECAPHCETGAPSLSCGIGSGSSGGSICSSPCSAPAGASVPAARSFSARASAIREACLFVSAPPPPAPSQPGSPAKPPSISAAV